MKTMAVLELMMFSSLPLVSGLAFANEAHEIFERMTDAKRNTVFALYLQKSGEDCRRVTKNFLQGVDQKGNAFWNVACSNNKSFVVQINNDAVGSTRILSCAVMKAVRGPECFKKF
jgi:hypothetical protein